MISIAPSVEQILDAGFLEMRFQPIVAFAAGQPTLRGVEALVRGPEESLFSSPALLCDFVRRKRAEACFDRACVRLALGQARALPRGTHLSVNVHAATLHRDAAFVDFLREEARTQDRPLDKLTIEIVEHAPNWADYRLGRTLGRLRELGIRLALDDIGSGHASFRMIMDMRPDVFKVDRYFVHGCAGDPERLAVLAALVELARRFGAQLVGEGLERAGDLVAARATGIEVFQGYLFSAALPAAEVIPRRLEEALRSRFNTPTTECLHSHTRMKEEEREQ